MTLRYDRDHIEPYYRIVVKPEVTALRMVVPEWEFRCGEVEPNHPDIVKITIPTTVFDFVQIANQQMITIHIRPTEELDDILGARSFYYTYSHVQSDATDWNERPDDLPIDTVYHAIRKGEHHAVAPLFARVVVPPLGVDTGIVVWFNYTSPIPSEAEPA